MVKEFVVFRKRDEGYLDLMRRLAHAINKWAQRRSVEIISTSLAVDKPFVDETSLLAIVTYKEKKRR